MGRVTENLWSFFVKQFLLCLFEQIGDYATNILSMIAYFSILGCLHSDEGSIVDTRNLPKDLGFSRAWLATHEDVARSHSLSKIFVVNLPHSILVSDGLRNNLLCRLLADDEVIEGGHEFAGRHVDLTSFSQLPNYLNLVQLCQLRQSVELLKVTIFVVTSVLCATIWTIRWVSAAAWLGIRSISSEAGIHILLVKW